MLNLNDILMYVTIKILSDSTILFVMCLLFSPRSEIKVECVLVWA